MGNPLRLDDLLSPEQPDTTGGPTLRLDDLLEPEPMRAAPIRAAAPPQPEGPRYDRFGEPLNEPARAEESAVSRAAIEHPSRAQQIGTGVAKAAFHDLPLGVAHFLTAPVRAVFAPPTPEELRNPLVRGGAMNRGGLTPGALDVKLHEAIAGRAGGVQDPGQVAGETARGLVTVGYDLERAAIDAETPEDKARAIANLGIFGALTAHGAATERTAAVDRMAPVPAENLSSRLYAALRRQRPGPVQGPLSLDALLAREAEGVSRAPKVRSGEANRPTEAPEGAKEPIAPPGAAQARGAPPALTAEQARDLQLEAADLTHRPAEEWTPDVRARYAEIRRQLDEYQAANPIPEKPPEPAPPSAPAEVPAAERVPLEPPRPLPTLPGRERVAVDPMVAAMAETGFAGGKPAGAVEVPPGQSIMGEGSTTAVMRRAQQIVGPEEFRRRVQQNIAARGGATDPSVEMAATEETARRIVAAPAPPVEALPPANIVRVPTTAIHADPARFQFKALGTEGVSGELKGVSRFNEQLAGVISVWRDPADGQLYVVNGHHRLELAQRTQHPALNVQIIDAPDATAARAEGAFMNIAEGRGTSTDVAKFLRDLRATPADLEARGVSLRGDLARDGMSLSRLAPDLFDQVATGKLSQSWGVAIGDLVEDPALQREAVAAARSSGQRLSGTEVREIARQVRDAGTAEATQETLFGTETERRGTYVARAQLAAAIKKRLAGDRRLFGFVSREGRAEELNRAGSTNIDVGAARGIAEQSARAEELFDRLYTRSGPIAEVINAGAKRIAAGEKAGTVAAELYPDVGEAVAREIAGGTGQAPRPDVGEPVGVGATGAREAEGLETAGVAEGRVPDSEDAAQAGMFSPRRPRRVDDITARRAGLPDDLKHDINLLGEEVDWRQAVTTPGADVLIGDETRGRIVTGAEDPVNGTGKAGMALVEHELEGRKVQRWYPATRLTPAAERPALELRAEAEGPAQASMFGERAGTTASRSLAETETAARGELETLRQRLASEKDPARRSAIAAQVAEREKLLNRARPISAEELRTEAAARGEEPETAGPDQMALFSPARQRSPLGERIRRLTGRTTPAEVADAQALISISRKLAEAVGVPLRQGRVPRTAEGVFKPFEEVTRSRRYDQLDTVAHEIGHYVSKKYLRNPTMRSNKFRGAGRLPVTLPKEAMRELVRMGRDLYGSRKPAGGYGEEGIAEWASFYVTDPAGLAEKAPVFSKYMEGVLDQEPALRSALDQAREDFSRYQASPSNARVAAMLSVGERVRFKPTVRWLMKTWLDDVYEFKAALRDLGVSRSPSKDAGVLARLTRGNAGAAEEMLARGVVKYGTLDRAAPSVEHALTSIRPERLQAFREYLAAHSALDRWQRGINPGISRADAETIAGSEANVMEFEKAAQAVWDHYRALIEYRRDAGLLTSAQAEQIIKANPHHVSFYRDFGAEEKPAFGGGGTGRGYARLSSGVKRQKGSARRILDPLESVFTDTYQTVAQVKKYEVARELVRAAQSTEGGGRLIERVPAPVRRVSIPVERVRDQLADMGFAPPGGQSVEEWISQPEMQGLLTSFEDARVPGAAEMRDLVVPLIERGEVNWYAVKDRALFDAMQGLGTPEVSGFMRWLSVPVRTLRAGATLTLEFAFGRNPVRDAWTSAIYSKAPFRPPAWRPAEGLFHMLKADDVYQAWRLEGGDNAAMLGVDRVKTQHNLARLMRTRTIGGKLFEIVRHPLDTLRLVSSLTENATRIGEFAAVRRGELARGAKPVEAGATAALAARDITVDFAQGGTAAKAMNMIVWTFNASLRGTAQLLREVRTRPATMLPRAVGLITVPSIALYLSQKDDPEYQDTPAWLRNTSWIWIQRGDDQGPGWDGFGTGKVVRRWVLPKPFELGVLFGTVPERITEWLDRRKPGSIRHMTEAMEQAFVPPVVPTAVAPLIENYANRSFFRDRPIVPRGREAFPPEEQTGAFTSETAQLLGDALGYSPAKIDNLVRGYAGGLGQYATGAVDAALRRAMGEKPPVEGASEDPLAHVPLIRAFVRRAVATDAESIEEFYRAFNEAEGYRLAWRELLKRGQVDEARAYFEKHRQEILRVATADQGGPGPLRVAYSEVQKLQQLRRRAAAAGAEKPQRAASEAIRSTARTFEEQP